MYESTCHLSSKWQFTIMKLFSIKTCFIHSVFIAVLLLKFNSELFMLYHSLFAEIVCNYYWKSSSTISLHNKSFQYHSFFGHLSMHNKSFRYHSFLSNECYQHGTKKVPWNCSCKYRNKKRKL